MTCKHNRPLSVEKPDQLSMDRLQRKVDVAVCCYASAVTYCSQAAVLHVLSEHSPSHCHTHVPEECAGFEPVKSRQRTD